MKFGSVDKTDRLPNAKIIQLEARRFRARY